MSPKTTPTLPSASATRLGGASPLRSAAAWAEAGLAVPPSFIAIVLIPPRLEGAAYSTAGCETIPALPGVNRPVKAWRSGVEIGRQRRRFAHQGNGHAAIGRHRRIIGKQRVGVGLARHLKDVRGRQ